MPDYNKVTIYMSTKTAARIKATRKAAAVVDVDVNISAPARKAIEKELDRLDVEIAAATTRAGIERPQ